MNEEKNYIFKLEFQNSLVEHSTKPYSCKFLIDANDDLYEYILDKYKDYTIVLKKRWFLHLLEFSFGRYKSSIVKQNKVNGIHLNDGINGKLNSILEGTVYFKKEKTRDEFAKDFSLSYTDVLNKLEKEYKQMIEI